MAESQNKLKGNRSKKPLIITLLIIGLLVWLLILYGTYAYLSYVTDKQYPKSRHERSFEVNGNAVYG